ncbi:hypothetical protein [Deinococcus sedimenti]|uniref:Uncharacterized protein n=1 Tax=Deinococcus sedimenti TaxID=1867090 RepID=A0ABQ2S718_9DEIO|nr:hypothetical protein [Deinococcus sedimenti]GGS03200.1 hypothetical protein GCM10008960_32290 [Deinococcus sedimenti]
MDLYTLTLAPEETFEVTAFEAAEYCTPNGHGLGRADGHGFLDLALLTREDRQVIRAPARLFTADVRRAAQQGWAVWIIHLHDQAPRGYEVLGVTIVTPTDQAADDLTDQLQAAATPRDWADVIAPIRGALLTPLSAYLTGEP